MTTTALNHLRKALSDTRMRWGAEQAGKYRGELFGGFEYIADNHRTFNSPHRDQLSEGTGFQLHLVAHRYVAFEPYKSGVIIVGLLHESMDIPTRLQQLRSLTRAEIAAVKTLVDQGRG